MRKAYKLSEEKNGADELIAWMFFLSLASIFGGLGLTYTIIF